MRVCTLELQELHCWRVSRASWLFNCAVADGVPELCDQVGTSSYLWSLLAA